MKPCGYIGVLIKTTSNGVRHAKTPNTKTGK